eukprot:CAMPEP_0114443364 /NCGR_PEP_ID=MMETSP0103-20121206/17484_1 /TAXON_ID=37642 ORGANISM="Paraphysomonas imperforata, Strain PA2" /NCGR_SAMPLE_ID=MMETSP0103 /ASSEMBLY_ACC=CAM_ASM_000201 /LENGTH=315 /DNA_ID=CAMNT_0001614771 /DNA_START=53 /DNA_END=1000 /DNA_ORIENTATION=-
MNDRLLDLRSGAAPPQSVALEVKGSTTNPLAAGEGQSTFMKQFFADVELVKQNILAVSTATKQICQINQEVVLATTPEKEQELSAGLSPVIQATNKKASVAKQLLQSLREDTERQKTSTASGEKNEIRIRENLVNTLTRKFVEVMKAYQNSQQKFKTDIKKKMKRQLKIVKPDATPEEIEAVVSTGGGSSEIFQNSILKGGPSDLKGGPSDSIMNASQQVKDKYQDVLTLETSMTQLHEMFVDFALLTEQQGEMLDQIEFQVKSADDFIGDANEDMVQAIDYQIAIRKKQACCLVIVLVFIGAIVGVVFAVKGSS